MDSFLKKLGIMSGGRQREEEEGVAIIDSGGLDVGSGLLFSSDGGFVEDHFVPRVEEKEEKEEEEEEEEKEKEDEEATASSLSEDKLDSGDEDETRVDKIYVISINDIPYYYESDLDKAKDQMLMLGNEFVKNLDERDGSGHKLLCDFRMKKIEIIAPYSFLGLTYNRSMYELTLEYAVKIR